jgi:uncharacterized membrane protein
MPCLPPSPLRHFVTASFLALIVLGLAWELWLAPLRPGAWLLSLKVMPLILALPAVIAGRLRAFQWWSMLILFYLAEGLVRAMSDAPAAARLAWLETVLAAAAFTAIVLLVHRFRRNTDPPPARVRRPS